MPAGRMSRRSRLSLWGTAVAVVLAVCGTMRLPGYALATIAALGVLVPAVQLWLGERLVKQRRHRRPVGVEEREAFVRRLRDEVSADLTTRLAWLDSTGDAEAPVALHYWAIESTSVHPEDADAREMSVETLAATVQRARTVALLGDGGTGKSTLLRVLQEHLLRRGAGDRSAPVPVVLGVSTWTEDDKDFVDWVTRGLFELYGLPQGVSELMVADGRVTILVDGYDELSDGLRQNVAGALGASVVRFSGGLVIASRTESYVATPPAGGMNTHVHLRRYDPTTLQHLLAETLPGGPVDPAVVDFLDTPLKLKMAVTALAGHQPAASGLDRTTGDPLTRLVSAYIRQRLDDQSREDYGAPFSVAEERSLQWIAERMRSDGRTTLDPDSIPYSWGPRRMQVAIHVLVPLLIGVGAGLLALPWLPPLLAGSVTALVWLSFTTDTRMWFHRDARVIRVAAALAALATAALLVALPVWGLVIALAGLAVWVHVSRHYAPRYVVAATLASAAAAQGAHLCAGLVAHPVLAGLLGAVAWALALVVAATALFSSCGWSVKTHAAVEGAEPPGPHWLVGMLTGTDVALWAGTLGLLPVLGVTIVCSFVGLDVSIGIVAVVSSVCTLFLVHTAMVMRARVVDHQLPDSLRVPLRASVVLAPLVILLDDQQKAVLALPLLLGLYLGLSFVRGSDAGFFRASEGGAFVRQLVYRPLLAREHLLPLRPRRLLDHAASRLIMRRLPAGTYEFDHMLIRDHLAQARRAEEVKKVEKVENVENVESRG